MTAEPRDVELIRADLVHERPDPSCGCVTPGCAKCMADSAAFREWRNARKRLVADVEPLLALLAAADRENAELRGEVERLREGYRVVCDQAERADLLQFQLAAAQAQLAEARSQLEHAEDRTNFWRGEARDAIAQFRAALSAAPQPEPDGPWAVDLICCDRDDGVQVCATWAEADAFRQSYMEPADHKRSGILHRATPGTRLGYHGRAPSLPAGTKKQPEPPASDEPARCEHGRKVGQWLNAGSAVGLPPRCPGPAASGTPDGGR